jgi:hypothetical protein
MYNVRWLLHCAPKQSSAHSMLATPTLLEFHDLKQPAKTTLRTEAALIDARELICSRDKSSITYQYERAEAEV